MFRLTILTVFLLVVAIIAIASTFGWRFTGDWLVRTNREDTYLTGQLKLHVQKLANEIGRRNYDSYPNLSKAAGFITEQLHSYGFTPEFQEYWVNNKKFKNIIVSKEGTQKPKEVFLVGAHYDSAFNPGADDNGSGVAVLLELARLLSSMDTKRSMKFVAFVNEEPPFFKTENMGSKIYAKAAKAKGEDIKGALILESVGYYSEEPNSQRYPPFFGLFYPNKGNFIGVVGNLRSRDLVERVVSNFKKETQFPIESIVTFESFAGASFSDNWAFWNEGYPAVMITDTAYYRNPNYHENLDTFETLNYESMEQVVKGLARVLIELTN